MRILFLSQGRLVLRRAGLFIVNSSLTLSKKLCALMAVALLLMLSACRTPVPEQPLRKHVFVRAAMGTQFRITIFAADADVARAAADTAFDRVDRLEEILSDYQADSELSLLREQPVGVPARVSYDLFEVLWRARRISEATVGAFDVTAGPYTRLWRFSRKRRVLPSGEELAAARHSVGHEKLLLDPEKRTVTMSVPGMRLDAGGIAKGYAADAALRQLRELGFQRCLVAASGDIAVGDPPPGQKHWSVAISMPGDSGQRAAKTLRLRNRAVSTSGDTEQFVAIGGTRYSHILDTRTGLGLTNRAQVTVVAPDATCSDPLATALRILGPAHARSLLRRFPGSSATWVTYEGEAPVVRDYR